MKLNDVKHNHSLTDLLKVILFALMMLLPFLDVGTRCAYVIANKNAYQSYYGHTINEEITTRLDNIEQLEDNNNYKFKNETYIDGSQTTGTLSLNVSNIVNNTDTRDLSSANKINIYYYNSNTYFSFYNGNTLLRGYDLNTTTIDFDFYLLNYSNTNNNVSLFIDSFIKTTYNKDSYLDNVFEYSVSQLENSQLYNWTTQTAIYSGVSEMTTQLGITGNFIPIILCYWLFITIIYILIDIVIKLFTLLTHAIGSKTA